jgi:uncharacterized protein DUF3309
MWPHGRVSAELGRWAHGLHPRRQPCGCISGCISFDELGADHVHRRRRRQPELDLPATNREDRDADMVIDDDLFPDPASQNQHVHSSYGEMQSHALDLNAVTCLCTRRATIQARRVHVAGEWHVSCPSFEEFTHPEHERRLLMGLILLIVLVLLLIGGLPAWGYSRNWGYAPSGILGLLLVVLLVLLLFSVIPWGFGPRVVVP